MSVSIGGSSQVGLNGADFSASFGADSSNGSSGTAEIEKMLGMMLDMIEKMLAQAIQQQNQIAGIDPTGGTSPAPAAGTNAGRGADAGAGQESPGQLG